MEFSKSTKPIRIAISGGRLAGATLINALRKYSHLDVHIYESSAEFSQRGAAVGMGSNALNALKKIGPETRDALETAGAGSGDNAGMILLDSAGDRDEDSRIVHRAAFLRKLLKPIPNTVIHTQKKLVKVMDAEENGGVILHFSDDTQEHADVLVGADGVHGYVRTYILGSDHPTNKPKFAGWWDCRNLVPFEKAVKTLGEEYFRENRQHSWIVVLIEEDRDPNEWKKPLDRKKLEDSFATWKDGPIAQGIIDLLLENPEPLAYAECDHSNAPTFVKGRVCMIGDAAHTMTPWQGSGASQAIEDVMILARLLGNTWATSQVKAAL